MSDQSITARIVRILWGRKVTIAVLSGMLALSPFAAHCWLQPLELNQFLIQRVGIKYGAAPAGSYVDLVQSSYSSGLNILWNRPARSVPAYTDPDALFRYVFSWLPAYARVYPTEGYYYFSFPHPEKGLVCGSLRLADLDHGSLTFNYFRMLDGDVDREVHIHHVTDVGVKKHGDYHYDVTHGGRRVSFRFQDSSFIDRPPEAVALLEDEEFVARMFDESGLRFFVLFNRATASFYYVLDEEDGVADSLVPIDENHHERGQRTGFVFFHDPDAGRRLLLGVSFRSVKRNDFFDGPGDQVPFRLHLRDRLNIAYPSTMVGKGVDPHGVMLDTKQWARFIISSYHQYADLEGMRDFTAPALDAGFQNKSDLWTALTKEWWHTRKWRKDQYAKLAKEGKAATPIIERASRLSSMTNHQEKRN